ncbi:putative 2-aminoethylphosphonate ABC transporter substrate-binding protein [Dechloromonas denitrificans]|uniref:putative 2-aminoethylphosphonate ABC transporter substrate-binding protein n=1 Tax=Dechloromonas denitrificans TaxID=281362 RepID=UPI001CF904AB|nr:putative 2-aminoethylphosphonate ABC transporter substrate-binding protein [Dechloromonas denitrificans]UCV02913.1 putative 2-aminoethylphosphonate ABC transporter substrate-binding protein [Dechloromonas denitrificans]UCV07234.1 putative 2-aminoethylphosphonate ABC transporter substrate-binding protein [Dechloromonas denitrificans]
MHIKLIAKYLTFAGLALAAALPAHAEKTVLNVYTALETDQLKAYQEGFNKVYPDIELKWTRDSTGIVTAKLLAEKAKPVADVIMGVAASSMVVFERQGMLQPYAPANLKNITPRYRAAANPPSWVGMNVWGAAICYNVVEMQKQGLPKIESWKDLLKPEFKGKIVMPNPASSGTGYLDVTAWLTVFGEKGGWEYMDKLHDNIAVYTHSGSKPCKMAGAGEFPVGISFEYRANATRNQGAPIDIVYPKEGLGWDIEAIAIVKGTPQLAAAKKLSDWASTKEAAELYAKNFAVVALPGVATRLKHVPTDYEQRLVKNDFNLMGKNREAVLTEWQKRYAGKSEPKAK